MSSIVYNKFGYNNKSSIYIGESKKEDRVCRFCGRKYPNVTFKHKAHAISESIGNKQFINREECDECNDKLSIAIEQDFYNYHAMLLHILCIKGKRGSRKIKTKDVIFDNDNGVFTINIRSKEIFLQKYATIELGNSSLDLSFDLLSTPFVPQNIYKCLCKYVIGMLQPQFMQYFRGTIDWIVRGLFPVSLPPVLVYTLKYSLDHPQIAYFIQNKYNDNYPFAIGCLEFANIGYFFLIPFYDMYDIQKIESTIYKKFKDAFRKLFNYNYQEINFSWHMRQTQKINLNFMNIIPDKTAFMQELSNENVSF